MASVPPRVQWVIATHTRAMREYNEIVLGLRALGATFGAQGRYEWEYRERHERAISDRQARLAEVEALAAQNGVSLDTLYAAVEGKPEVLPWSDEAMSWRPRGDDDHG